MHNSSGLCFRESANGGESNYTAHLNGVNVYVNVLVIENTWTSTRDLSSAKSPNAKISVASPIPAVYVAINEKYIAIMAGPKHLACVHIQIASAMLA